MLSVTDLSFALHRPRFSLATIMPNQTLSHPLENDPALSSLVCSSLAMTTPNQMINYPLTCLRTIQLYQVKITHVTSATTKPNWCSELFCFVLTSLAKVKVILSKPNSGGGRSCIPSKMWHSLSLSSKKIYKTPSSKHASRRGIL